MSERNFIRCMACLPLLGALFALVSIEILFRASGLGVDPNLLLTVCSGAATIGAGLGLAGMGLLGMPVRDNLDTSSTLVKRRLITNHGNI